MALVNILSKIFGNKAQRDRKEIEPYVKQILEAHKGMEKLSHDELRAISQEMMNDLQAHVAAERAEIEALKAKIEELEIDARKEAWEKVDKINDTILSKLEDKLNELLPKAFALMKETATRFTRNEEIVVTATDFDRDLAVSHDFIRIEGDKAIYLNRWIAGGNEIVWDMIHYDVQLFGGVVLHKGKIAEMATGEGKTLVATLPVFLNALTHNGVHVVTVNDYLSKRDSEWMGPLYMFHGLSVDCIDKHEPNSAARKRAYNCDITFGTNNEFGFDYLRDNMASSPDDLVQRMHNYAIVDEVDSVLIDDARTPLIISGPIESSGDKLFEEYRGFVEAIVEAQKKLASELLLEAKQKIKSEDKKEQEEGFLLLYRSFKALPRNKPLIKFLSEEGMKAGMIKTEEFYMQDNNRQMYIVTDPLYFVIDEKNSQIDLTDKGLDFLAKLTGDAQFFVLPDIASQMSELENLALTEEEKSQRKDELLSNFSVQGERVHTLNQLMKAYTLFEKDDQYVVMENKVLIVDEQTGRIMDGRRYSDGLHQAIEAKERVRVESASQTMATITLQNYFRMYKKLAGMTGTAETEAAEFWDIYKLDVVVIPTNRPILRNDMNDRVYKTDRAKYNAVIEEIVGLVDKGRPVLVGTTSVEISELLSRMLTLRKIQHNVLNAKLHQKEAEIVALAGQKGTVTIATNMAGRGTDIKLSPEVKAAGGLAIIGTERHESRRVDRQLRGRAGRQGDPGSSIFFVSLQDKLMRLFASERLAPMMDKLGFGEDDVLESGYLSKAVENAQKKVEENNFGIRKHLLEYDDVKNSQRKVIYTRRHHALLGERITLDVMNTINQCADAIGEQFAGSGRYEDFTVEVLRVFAIQSPITEEQFKKASPLEIGDYLTDAALEALKRRSEKIKSDTYPVIHRVFEEQGHAIRTVHVPISDGKSVYNVPVDLAEADSTQCQAIVKAFQKTILLYTIDEAWKEHLREMDELQRAVRNASYENKDPLVIFKVEAYELFKTMVEDMNKKATAIIMRGKLPIPPQEEGQPEGAAALRQAPDRDMPKPRTRYTEHKDDVQQAQDAQREAGMAASAAGRERVQPYVAPERIGRNDPCPCGSGKKFKQCHGRNL
ncbi:preprotein translocase subunit SecA [Porphyromonas sp. COT-108 OH1349]|uniref:preprotein translocase subunit SecA n=1 Tax=Porphyromonas sp. COT-108 OH1349 TaxID=1537504 RepID=UPI00052BB6DD|nr:preprotein translocase subunit SecA [Porphyromonas sp. COT-108 OH1349]KGN69491.1 preprotein translocase subunit SecA [Porphyromonas sp. COT-108 OH1349]